MKKLVVLLMLSNIAFAQDKDVLVPSANLITEGIPALPVSIKKDVMRYTESRSAGFVSWHPVQTTMLVSTRFGNVPQIHQVMQPQGARKQLTFFEDAISNGSYEPVTGKYFLFSKDEGGNEFAQMYRYDLTTGDITLLSDGGRSQNSGMNWNHTGTQIAYTSTRRNGADRDIYTMNPSDPATNKMIFQLSGGGWRVADWSPDDKRLLLMEYKSANESHLWLADIATGNQSPLTDPKEANVSYGRSFFSKNGKGVYLLSDKDNEFKRLGYLDIGTGKMNWLTNIKWDIEDCEMSEDGNLLAFTTNEAGASALYLMHTNTQQYKKVEGLPEGVYAGISFHRNNQHLAFNINAARAATDVFVLDIASGKTERWTESELGGLVPAQLSIPSLVQWSSFDGKEISGFYYKPPAKFTGKRPVIINIHGGPEGQSRPGFQGANNYYLNEMGIALIYPNVRGSSGFGKTFVALDNGMKREESVKDIGALLDWIAKQPDLDASRVMVTGGSYGGYMTLAVATHYNDRIKCALDVVGISNFNTFLKNTESYRRDLRRVEYGDERDSAMSAFFEKISPLNNAYKIKKPMFIVQGGNDPRVPRTEARQMADKIKSNGGVIWYLEAKDEGHGFKKKTNADFQRYATIQFIRQFLLDGM